MANEAQKQLCSTWRGPKSVCTCGHLGDGSDSDHGPFDGHGACRVEGCDCQQFTWAGWNEQFQGALDQLSG